MRKQFHHDRIVLKSLYLTFRASESFYEDDYTISAYRAFYDLLHALCAKYKTTPRQLSACLNV